MSRALLRYLLSTVLRSQRFIAPATVYVAMVLIFNTDPGPVLGTYAATSSLLLPVSIWLSYLTANCEDAAQEAITIATVASATRVRLAKAVTALVLSVPLIALAVAMPAILQNYHGAFTGRDLLVGGAAHLLVTVAGTAIGTALAHPIVERAGTAFLVASGATLVELLVPNCPPTRQLLVLLDRAAPEALLRGLALTALETLAWSATLIAAALYGARRRS